MLLRAVKKDLGEQQSNILNLWLMTVSSMTQKDPFESFYFVVFTPITGAVSGGLQLEMEKRWADLKNHSRMMVDLFLHQPSERCSQVKAYTKQKTLVFGGNSGAKSVIIKQLGVEKNGPDSFFLPSISI